VKYLLEIQFSDDDISFDELVELEDRLAEALKGKADVDGHEMGSGEADIFICRLA